LNTLFVLIRRNILVYSKNRANIFFSCLSMIIIIGLMLVFLGDVNINIITGLLYDMDQKLIGANLNPAQLVAGSRNAALDVLNSRNLVMSIVIAGITVVNGVTVSLGVVGRMIEDEENKRLTSFFISPISRATLVLGYIMAAFIVSVLFSTATVILSEAFLLVTGGTVLSLNQTVKVFGLILLNSFSATCMMFFFSVFIHTISAFSGLSTIIGTLVGFIAGIYLPMGMLPKTVAKVLVIFPICSGSALMREAFTEKAITDTFAGLPLEALDKYREYMGITLKFGDKEITYLMQLLILLGSGIILIALSAFLLRNKNVRDR